MKAFLLFVAVVFAANIAEADPITIQLPFYSDILGNAGDQVSFNGALRLDQSNSNLDVVTHSPAISFYSPGQDSVIAHIRLQKLSGTQFKIVGIERLSNNSASNFIFKQGGVFDFSGVFAPAAPPSLVGMAAPRYLVYQDESVKRFIRFNVLPSNCNQELRPGTGGAQ